MLILILYNLESDQSNVRISDMEIKSQPLRYDVIKIFKESRCAKHVVKKL